MLMMATCRNMYSSEKVLQMCYATIQWVPCLRVDECMLTSARVGERSPSSRGSKTRALWTSARLGAQRYSFRTGRTKACLSRSRRRRTCAGNSVASTIVGRSMCQVAAAASITTVPTLPVCPSGERRLRSLPYAAMFASLLVLVLRRVLAWPRILVSTGLSMTRVGYPAPSDYFEFSSLIVPFQVY